MADIIPFNRTEPDTMATKPIHVGNVGAGTVSYFIPPSAAPGLPWCPVEDIGYALGMDDDGIVALTLRIAQRWLPWLKTVDTPDGKKVIIPLLGVTALLVQCGGAAAEQEIMEGAATAMDLSLAEASPSERFQALIVAARAASSPGEVNSLFGDVVAEASA